MNYVISYLCLANKIHMRLLLMGFIMASYEKIWFDNTHVSQFKTTQPCFHIDLGSRGAEPPRYLGGLEYPLAHPSPPPQKNSYILIINLDWKRAWNYAYLAHQIQNFLKQGALATPKIVYICMTFDRKGTEIVNLWFP